MCPKCGCRSWVNSFGKFTAQCIKCGLCYNANQTIFITNTQMEPLIQDTFALEPYEGWPEAKIDWNWPSQFMQDNPDIPIRIFTEFPNTEDLNWEL